MNKRGYFDPGTGGYLLSSLWAAIVGLVSLGIAFVLRIYKDRIKPIFGKKSTILLFSVLLVGLFVFCLFSMIRHYERYQPTDISGDDIYDIGHNEESQQKNLPTNMFDNDFYNLVEDKIINISFSSFGKDYSIIKTPNSFDGYIQIHDKVIDNEGNLLNDWMRQGIIDNNGLLYNSNFNSDSSKTMIVTDSTGKITLEKVLEHNGENYSIHHLNSFTNNGNIAYITSHLEEYRGRQVLFDSIFIIDKDGNIIDYWSTYEHLDELKKFHGTFELDVPELFDYDSPGDSDYEYYHTNTVSFVPHNSREDEGGIFKEGNMILTFRHGSIIVIIDKDSKKPIWSITQKDIPDHLEGQHSSKMMPDGNIVTFDNGRYRKWSRVIVLEPISKEIVWEYDLDEFCEIMGGVSYLPNGDFLISEWDKILEVTPDKEIVWQIQRRGKLIGVANYYPKEYFNESVLVQWQTD